MRILVTGASGMLGKNLLENLNYVDNEVTLFIRNKEKFSDFKRKDLIKKLL